MLRMSFNLETEKIALMPTRSSTIRMKIPNQKVPLDDRIQHNISIENDTTLSSLELSHDQQQSILSTIPINRHHSQSFVTSLQLHHDEDSNDHINNEYFLPTQLSLSQISVDLRKKVKGIYVLPVSPALSSSSSIRNMDDIKNYDLKTMSHKSRICFGIENKCFTDSPKSKDRELRFIQPPAQPPPLPPMVSQINLSNKDQSSLQQHSTLSRMNAPPVAFRTRKPLPTSIGLEALTNLLNEKEPSPQDDSSERTWPKPPDSVRTSVISRPSSISYDHLMPTVVMHQNSTMNVLHQYQHDEDSILTESDVQ